MSQANETREPASNMDQLKEEAATCGSGCGCHAGGAAGRSRWVLGAVIVLIAAALVVRALTKDKQAIDSGSASAYAVPASAAAPTVETEMASSPSGTDTVVTVSATGNAPPAPTVAETESAEAKMVACGEMIGSFGDLNRKAMSMDGVFVFLAGKDAAKARAAATVVEKTADVIRGRGMSLGLFTIGDSSKEYADLAAQVPPPGVIALVKGRGASAVSGDITEAKLMQAFVAASSGGGGCGSSGGGCGPASSGCN